MQTFLPLPTYSGSASCLDNKRLGKQRVECLQILNALRCGPYQKLDGTKWVSCSVEQYQPYDTYHRRTPWYNHPATQMWKGYEWELCIYAIMICKEWRSRGFNDTCLDKFNAATQEVSCSCDTYPPFIGDESFHASHRSNLLRKDPTFYSNYGWTEPLDLPYIWPVQK